MYVHVSVGNNAALFYWYYSSWGNEFAYKTF